MVTIVIVNWNSGPFLNRCLLSLRSYAAGCEITVVDNASEDDSLRLDFPEGQGPKILRNDRNMGFAAACNQGWRQSRSDRVLFLNPDTEATAGSVDALADSLESEPLLWAVGGCLVSPEGSVQIGFNVRAFPSLRSVASEMLLLDSLWPSNPWGRQYRLSDWDHASPRQVDQPAGACLMIRRAALQRLDGFDESFYPAWFEDVDLCRRVYRAGGRIGFQPEARFLHHGGTSLNSLSRSDFLDCFHTNQLRYFRKHEGEATMRRIRRLVVAGMVLRAAVSLLHPPNPLARGEAFRTYWKMARRIAGLRRIPS